MQMNLASRMSSPSQSDSEPSFTKKKDIIVKSRQKIGFEIELLMYEARFICISDSRIYHFVTGRK